MQDLCHLDRVGLEPDNDALHAQLFFIDIGQGELVSVLTQSWEQPNAKIISRRFVSVLRTKTEFLILTVISYSTK